MSSVTWPLNYFFPSHERKIPERKSIHFNQTVKGIEIPRTPPEFWYQRADYNQFKNEAKASTNDRLEDQNLRELAETSSKDLVITSIFTRALSYLRQLFSPTSRSTSLEEDLSSPLLSPPPKPQKNIRRQEKNPWMLVPDPILSEEIPSLDPEENRWILIRKSIIGLIPEERHEFDNLDADNNTSTNKVVTNATTSIWKRLKKRKALKELEKKLEPT